MGGQGKEKDVKVTVFKKTDETYMLKMKNSREFFSAVSKKHGPMPFTLRSCENETKAKMGVVESVKSIEDLDIQKLLKTSANPKTAKKKKKAAEKAVAGETVPQLVEQ